MPTASNTSGPIALALPATSANLGAAFDAAALALNLHLRVSARPAVEFTVAAEGRDAFICAQPDGHLVLDVYRHTLAAAGRAPQPIALHLNNQIPIGKGCGSSAAARLAGLMLAVHFAGLDWTSERIVGEAAQLEGHADNAAACWWGGMVATKTSEGMQPAKLRMAPLPIAVAWPLLLVVPEKALATEESRATLPASYARADVVANLQSALFLAAAFSHGRADLLRYGFEDRLHEPYREPLCPCLRALRPLAGDAGIVAMALSGAGPSVLVVLDCATDRRRSKAAIERRLAEAGLEAELIEAAIELQGARTSFVRAGESY